LANLTGAAVDAADRVQELEHIEASKSRFIRVATHELRSPVAVAQSLVRTVLKGYAGPVDKLQRDIFDRIGGRLDFLESLVNDLLDLAAGKAPELEEDEGPVVLNTSVGRTLLLLEPRAEEKGVSLTFHPCREQLPVWGTDGGLDRIFVNLIGNAIKYTPPQGSVTVSVSCGGGVGQVEVTDTGIGIPEESLSHLWEEFFRAPNVRDLEVGTGLGLAIVKDLVDRYRGTIEVTSEVGQGTRFVVSFPIYVLGN
jgi:signal transduction histidine kinase